VHDYFEILGVQPGAPAAVIRRASLRRGAALHPDFRPAEARAAQAGSAGQDSGRDRVASDAAVDFIDMNDLVDSMEIAFFRSRG
jgi:curved DNA-binding protein CbpA